jgi:basic membrane protein A and related proteins
MRVQWMRTRALLSVVLFAVLAACGTGDGPIAESQLQDDAADTGSDQPVVRVVTVTPVTAGSWDPSHHVAYQRAAAAGNWDLQIAEALPYGEAEQVFNRWGDEKVDVVFSTDNGFEEPFLRAAERYPDTAWVMMTGLSSTNNLPNVAAFTFDWCEMGFAQGAAAALVSESGRVAQVGAIEILPAQLTVEGHQAGAEAVGRDVEFVLEYTGDFISADRAQEVTSAMIQRGADTIIAITHGGVSPQIAGRAQDEGAQYIGTFADEREFAPEAVVTSVAVDFTSGYQEAVDSWLDGTFEPVIHVRGFADGMLMVIEFQEGFEDAATRTQELVDQLAAGEVTFPEDGMCAASS